MPKQFNESNDKFDTFTKMYHKVLASNELSLLQKYLISDVISFQIKGMPYMRTSKSLAKMLGDYKKGTISKSFQDLARKGIIITRPDGYGDKTDSQYDLRFVEVVNIDQWIRSDEYLESTGFVPEEIIPQSNWIQSKTNSKEAKNRRKAESNVNTLKQSIVSEEEEDSSNEIDFNLEEGLNQSNENSINNQRTIFDEIKERELLAIKSDSKLQSEAIRIVDDSLKYSNKSITLSNGTSVRLLDDALHFFIENARKSDGFVREGKSKLNQEDFDEYLLGCMNFKLKL
jgi:hypothetical protein